MYSVHLRKEIHVFLTHPIGRHDIMSNLAGEGQQVWTYAKITSDLPWYLVSYDLKFPEYSVGESMCCSAVEQLIKLLSYDEDTLVVKHVMLVSPYYMNQSSDWQMDPLHQIWEGQSAEDGHTVLVFKLADGRQFVDEFRNIDTSTLRDMTCLMAFTPAPTH